MRWKLSLHYLGTAYAGWQRQPDAVSVQQVVEEALSTILRQPIEITGCGRTDAGVHARNYIAHFDAELNDEPGKVVYHVNAILPHDISIQSISATHDTFHARYDAIWRHYRYYMHAEKDPLLYGRSFYFHPHAEMDQDKMKEAAALFIDYKQFKPFCKTGSDAENYQCQLIVTEWSFEEYQSMYSIRANRFLRGMVRLIVGACLNVGLGKISVEDVKRALETQQELRHAWSVPPEGLFLESVTYPDTGF
jgi:tRNA pseudouridine38-40 synthase